MLLPNVLKMSIKTTKQLQDEYHAELPNFEQALGKINQARTGSNFRPCSDVVHFQGDHDFPAEDLNINQGITPTYPAEFFMANEWTKPILTLPKLLPLKEASAGVKAGFRTGKTITSFDLKAFLRSAMSHIQATCPDNWVSFGVSIATEKEKKSLLCLCFS